MAKHTVSAGASLLGLAGAAGVGVFLGLHLGGKATVWAVQEGYLTPSAKALKEAGAPSDVIEAIQRSSIDPSLNERGQYGG
jgi:hypothetical protein